MTSSSNTINYVDFEPSNLTFTKLEPNERTNGQLIGYPRYTKNGIEIPLEIQLPWITISTYGVPKEGKHYPTDDKRSFLKLPLDLTIPEVAAFAEKLKQLDSIYGSPEMMTTLLGKKAKKYKYIPLYREAKIKDDESDDEEDDKQDNNDKKNSEPKLPYFNIKLKLSYPDKKVESKVFESDESKETGKRDRKKVDVSTVDEFASYIRWKSDVRGVVKPFKIWAHPLSSNKDPKEFGISCRLERVEVEKASITGTYKSIYDSEKFIDSDDEKLPKINSLKVGKNGKASNDSSDDSSNESSDDEKVTKPNVDVAYDSEDENVEENAKLLVEIPSDDSDEEVVVAKPTKGKKKGKKSN